MAAGECPKCQHGGCEDAQYPLGTGECRCTQMWQGELCDDASMYNDPLVITFYVAYGLIYLVLFTFCIRQLIRMHRTARNQRHAFKVLLLLTSITVAARIYNSFIAYYSLHIGLVQVLHNMMAQFTMLFLMHRSTARSVSTSRWTATGIALYFLVLVLILIPGLKIVMILAMPALTLLFIQPCLLLKSRSTRKVLQAHGAGASLDISAVDHGMIKRCNRLSTLVILSMSVTFLSMIIPLALQQATSLSPLHVTLANVILYSIGPVIDVFANLAFWSPSFKTMLRDHCRSMLCLSPKPSNQVAPSVKSTHVARP